MIHELLPQRDFFPIPAPSHLSIYILQAFLWVTPPVATCPPAGGEYLVYFPLLAFKLYAHRDRRATLCEHILCNLMVPSQRLFLQKIPVIGAIR
jgi:hypothetical protein